MEPSLAPGPKLLYLALLAYCSYRGNTSFPSGQTLATGLAINRETVFKYASILRERGLLTSVQKHQPSGKFSHTEYTLYDPKSPCRVKPSTVPPVTVQTVAKKEPVASSEEVIEERDLFSREGNTELRTARELDAVKIYEAYPRKVARPKAIQIIGIKLKVHQFDFLMARTSNFSRLWKGASRDDLQYCPHPTTWFNQDRFNDDPGTWNRPKSRESINGNGNSLAARYSH
jgi:hypothetical protein